MKALKKIAKKLSEWSRVFLAKLLFLTRRKPAPPQANDQIVEQITCDLAKGHEAKDQATYLTYEKGCVQYALGRLATLSQSLDRSWLRATNDKGRAQHDALACKRARNSQTARDQYQADCQDVQTRKGFQLSRLTEQLTRREQRRDQLDQGLSDLSQGLPYGIDHRKSYWGKRVLLILGIIVASICESAIAFNSLKILRAPLLLEGLTAVGIGLGLFALAKGVVYCGSHANFLSWGQSSVSDKPRAWKIGLWDMGAISLAVTGLGFSSLLGDLRIQYLAASGVALQTATKCFLYLAGPFMFTATTVLSMFLNNPMGQRQGYYSKVLHQFRRAQKGVKALQKELAQKGSAFLRVAQSLRRRFAQSRLAHGKE